MFWSQGFDILQHIDDRLTLSSQVKRARDQVTLRDPLKDLQLNNDDNYKYQVEKHELNEDTQSLPELWR